jgi:geranylgeranyl diphosphate synthase type I
VLGWQAAGGAGDAEQVVRVAAALEMFLAFALIHDDAMDHSELRRGQPTVHRTQAIRCAPGRTAAEAEELGKHTPQSSSGTWPCAGPMDSCTPRG